MDDLKGFIFENKKMILLAVSITLSVFLVFSVIAVIANSGNEDGTERKTSVNNTTNITTTENQTTENKTTEAPTVTVDQEEGKIDETEAETETQAPIDYSKLIYSIKVNRALNCITIYEKDDNGDYTIPVKAIVCSTGKNLGDTPIGTFNTKISYNWLLMVDGTYGQYAYRFYGSILFHSVPYFTKDKGDLEYEQYNKLGGPASLGCVRVNVRDAIWLIENCPVGTQVIVYDDPNSPGPLGKPESIKIPLDSPYRGWDPTDPDPENPWHNFSAEIKVENSSISLAPNTTINDVLKAINYKAKDTCGNDITDKVTYENNIDFKTPGTYSLTLKVTDAIGSTDEESVTVVVKNQGTITVKSSDISVYKTDTMETVLSKIAYKGTDILGKDITSKISYSGSVDFTKVGKYELVLSFIDKSYGNISVKVYVNVLGTDPVIKTKTTTVDLYLNSSQTELKSAIKTAIGYSATDYKGTDITSLVVVDYTTADLTTAGIYNIKITVKDTYNNSAEKSITLKLKNKASITADNTEITISTTQTIEDVLVQIGYHASDLLGKDISDQVEYTTDLDSSQEGEYDLELFIPSDVMEGNIITIKVTVVSGV